VIYATVGTMYLDFPRLIHKVDEIAAKLAHLPQLRLRNLVFPRKFAFSARFLHCMSDRLWFVGERQFQLLKQDGEVLFGFADGA